MNYENIAKILFLIDKHHLYFMCQLRHYLKKHEPDLLIDLDQNETLLKSHLCSLRGL